MFSCVQNESSNILCGITASRGSMFTELEFIDALIQLEPHEYAQVSALLLGLKTANETGDGVLPVLREPGILTSLDEDICGNIPTTS